MRICVNNPGTNWRTADGITIGTDLKNVQRINDGPFNLAGFGWDGGGATESWQNGKLAGKGCELFLDLIPDFPESDQRKTALSSQVMGDRPFSSANPVMQELNPTVHRLCLFYR